MKREILFRIWDNEEKKFFKPIYESYAGRLLDLSISTNGRLLRRTIEMPAEDESMFEERYKIQQFTGLTDKSGKKIFEGDVVLIGVHKTKFVAYDMIEFSAYIERNYTYQPEFEVIGNIYDNPELLK